MSFSRIKNEMFGRPQNETSMDLPRLQPKAMRHNFLCKRIGRRRLLMICESRVGPLEFWRLAKISHTKYDWDST